MNEFNVQEYWEDRLSSISLDNVGYRGLGEKYNDWLYRMKKRELERCLERNQISIQGKKVLDLGAGSGFYVELWKRRGASKVVGIDVTKAAVNFLQEKYPEDSFLQSDISDPRLPEVVGEVADVVSAFDVLYHIVDDHKFEIAIRNVSRLCNQGGYFLLSDCFMRYQEPVCSYYLKSRALRDYQRVLGQEGFHILEIVPIFHIMIPPADSKFRRLGEFQKVVWSTILRIHGLSQDLAGRLAYTIDLGFNMLGLEGPSTKILLCRKT